MKINNYNRVSEIDAMLDMGMIPTKRIELGISLEGGMIEGLYDKKAKCLYLEHYDSLTHEYEISKFQKSSIPERWNIDVDTEIDIKMDFD